MTITLSNQLYTLRVWKKNGKFADYRIITNFVSNIPTITLGKTVFLTFTSYVSTKDGEYNTYQICENIEDIETLDLKIDDTAFALYKIPNEDSTDFVKSRLEMLSISQAKQLDPNVK